MKLTSEVYDLYENSTREEQGDMRMETDKRFSIEFAKKKYGKKKYENKTIFECTARAFAFGTEYEMEERITFFDVVSDLKIGESHKYDNKIFTRTE